MPLFEFKCDECGRVTEKLYPSFALAESDTQHCDRPRAYGIRPCTGSLKRITSAPAFKVNGYNAATGYAGIQKRVTRHNGIRTEVIGNFEAFDRLT